MTKYNLKKNSKPKEGRKGEQSSNKQRKEKQKTNQKLICRNLNILIITLCVNDLNTNYNKDMC